jgi:hypothetical protein
METVQWEICSDETFAVGDRKCSDFKVVDSYTLKTNDNRKLYFVETAYTLEWKEYLPGKENSIISTIGIIFDGDGSWEIISESFEFFNGKQVFANHSDEIIHMMKSFSLNPNIQQQDQPTTKSIIGIPSWIKNNAGWWADGAIDDNSFVQGIQFLIKEGIMEIPPTAQGSGSGTNEIPSWIKNNAGWWADGAIDDNSFVQGIQFLIKEGIMSIS